MMHKPSKDLSLLVFALLHGLNHALQLVLPPLYLAVRDDLGTRGLGPVMFFSTIYFVVYAATSLPYGVLSDRFSKKKILVFGAGLNSIALFLAAGCSSYKVFVIAMILAGLGGGAYHPVASALISNIFGQTLGRAFGLIGMGASIGLFAGPFVSGLIAQHFGWRMSFLAFAVIGCLVSASFALIMAEEEKGGYTREGSSFPLGVYIKALLPVILVFGMRDFCLWGATYLTPAMTQMNLGFSKELAGMLIGFMSLTGIVSQPLAGALSDRFGRRLAISVALIGGGLTVFSFPYLSGSMIFVSAIITGFMLLGTVPVIDAAAAEIVPPSVRGKVFGVLMTFGLMFGALSPYSMGLIHDLVGGYGMAYSLLAVSGLAGALLVLKIPSKRPHSIPAALP